MTYNIWWNISYFYTALWGQYNNNFDKLPVFKLKDFTIHTLLSRAYVKIFYNSFWKNEKWITLIKIQSQNKEKRRYTLYWDISYHIHRALQEHHLKMKWIPNLNCKELNDTKLFVFLIDFYKVVTET